MSEAASIYVLEIGNRVKVGRSAHPVRRLKQHKSAAIAHGRKVGREWISRESSNPCAAERDLVALCAQVAPQYSREYFEMPFEDAVSIASSIDLDQPSESRSGMSPDEFLDVMKRHLMGNSVDESEVVDALLDSSNSWIESRLDTAEYLNELRVVLSTKTDWRLVAYSLLPLAVGMGSFEVKELQEGLALIEGGAS